jgi:hypothetical protein
MELPAGNVSESLIAPLPDVNPVAPPLATAVHDEVVIPAGKASAIVAPVSLLGPALLTTTV